MQCRPRAHCRVDIYILSPAGRKSSSHSFTEDSISAWFSFQCTPYSNDCEALCPFSDLSVQNIFMFHHCTLISVPSDDKEKAFEDKERLFWLGQRLAGGGRCLSRACLLLRKVAVVQISRCVQPSPPSAPQQPLPINHPLLFPPPYICLTHNHNDFFNDLKNITDTLCATLSIRVF